jgi:uncharacterized membrane protein YhaH (DUF805 family)
MVIGSIDRLSSIRHIYQGFTMAIHVKFSTCVIYSRPQRGCSQMEFLFFPSGRIGRGKWWLGQLAIGSNLGLWAGLAFVGPSDLRPIFTLIMLVMSALNLWVNFCVSAQRYHDLGKSGWWFLLVFVPLIGPIWQLIELGFISGDLEDNEYGSGPGMNIEDDLLALAGMPERNEAFASRNFTPLPVAAPARPGPGSLKPAFGKRS